MSAIEDDEALEKTGRRRLSWRGRFAPRVGPSAEASAGSPVRVTGIRHLFGENEVLRGVDLSAEGGEFVTLLGPSGSGKTTLLRIVAGLVDPTAGAISIDGRDVTKIAVQHRDIGFVFQNYALFPHLTVRENLEFPLKLRGLRKESRKSRSDELLKLVSLKGFGSRYPSQLSGGQQQRVALARAMAHRPKVLLMDEPLGSLDRRLRQQLGGELRRIQQSTAITAVYVTHDQEEAFLLSDRIMVMNEGRIYQEGAPSELYYRPTTRFVAEFLGEINVLPGTVRHVVDAAAVVETPIGSLECSCVVPPSVGEDVLCLLRPEQIAIRTRNATGQSSLGALGMATVEDLTFIGSRFRLNLRIGDVKLMADVDAEDAPPVAATVAVVCKPGSATAITNQ